MSASSLKLSLLAMLLAAGLMSPATAQVDECCEPCLWGEGHDLQFFKPVDYDLDCSVCRRTEGFRFSYEKVGWAFTGERSPIGDPNVQVFSEIIYPEALVNNPLSVTDRTYTDAQYEIINGLQDVPPWSDFAMGDRYELGYRKDDTSWDISVLHNVDSTTEKTYGFGPEASGFGSIHVNFATTPDLLLGFRDYWGTGVTDPSGFFVFPTTTLNGPGGVADGIADDLDGDGTEGIGLIIDPATGDAIGIVVDLDDLHLFNVTFNRMTVHNHTEVNGVELMKTHYLDNGHWKVKHQNQQLSIGYGVRFMRLKDEFEIDALSDLLNLFYVNTQTENQIVGPQVRLQYTAQRGRWNFGLDTRVMLGYNVTDLDQWGYYGIEDDQTGDIGLRPGAQNDLLSLQPTTYAYGRQHNEFSPVAELRADLEYAMTQSISLQVGYTATYIGNLSRGASVTQYSLPNMGFLEAGQQEILMNGVNAGVNVVW